MPPYLDILYFSQFWSVFIRRTYPFMHILNNLYSITRETERLIVYIYYCNTQKTISTASKILPI